MAEAALHLLPHLFMPHHDDDHGHGDGHKPLGDACTLIAVGFLAAFAIDRFVGVSQQQQQQQQQKNHQPEQKVELEEMDPAAVTTAGTHAAAALEDLRGGDVAAVEEIAVTAGVAGAADATESTEAATAAGVAALTQEEGEEEETQETGQQAEERSLPEAAVPAAPASEHNGDSQGGGGGDEGAVEGDDGPREFVSSSSATDVDEGSAAGAMLASAHMTQTPEKRPPATPGDAASSDGDDALKVAPEDTVPEGGTPQPSPEVPPAAAPFSAEAAAPSSEPAGGAASAGTAPPPPPPPPAGSPELTRYGNPREGAVNAAVGSEQEGLSDGHCAAAVASTDAAVADAKGVAVAGGGGDLVCSKVDNHHHHHHDHHDDHHGPADAGAYVTLAVDFLHNVIDGIGIGAAYAVGGDVIGHTTAALKLVHEVQHEIGDVATLVQCGMSKHHAIHIQHTTAAGVFLGVAISLGAGAFPEGLLASCLALSAGATFHLASGTVLGPVLAIPADVGGPFQGLLEVAALAAGAAGVVAVGLAEGWAGIGH
ncbi:unnamed protein product [Scytosiphon promiscuus]